ncbi:MAG: hypothetical protein NC225_09300 [Clostridium sp.]|nr:hypothetical protein [Clostridium sp.]MCM1399659.1 hypothetical protein [Clostridium sp.]MCM1460519.1 hypothetical protein [Bacteroides sp.]
MGDNKYFHAALSKMVSEFAYADSVIRLHEKGLSPEKIREQLLYPVSIGQINKVIADYEKNKQSESQYEYVQETNEYGRKSFRRVRKKE